MKKFFLILILTFVRQAFCMQDGVSASAKSAEVSLNRSQSMSTLSSSEKSRAELLAFERDMAGAAMANGLPPKSISLPSSPDLFPQDSKKLSRDAFEGMDELKKQLSQNCLTLKERRVLLNKIAVPLTVLENQVKNDLSKTRLRQLWASLALYVFKNDFYAEETEQRMHKLRSFLEQKL